MQKERIALDKQNQFPSQTIILDIIANSGGTAESALALYQPALNYYDRGIETAPNELDSIKAELNSLSLLLDIQEFLARCDRQFTRKYRPLRN